MSNTHTKTPAATYAQASAIISVMEAIVIVLWAMLRKLDAYKALPEAPPLLSGINPGYKQHADRLSIERFRIGSIDVVDGDVKRAMLSIGLLSMDRGFAYLASTIGMGVLAAAHRTLDMPLGGKRGRDWTLKDVAGLGSIGFVVARFADKDADKQTHDGNSIRGFGPVGLSAELATALDADKTGARLTAAIGNLKVVYPVKSTEKDGTVTVSDMTLKQAQTAARKTQKDADTKRKANEAERKANPSATFECDCKQVRFTGPYSVWKYVNLECTSCKSVAVVSPLVKASKGEGMTFTISAKVPATETETESAAATVASAAANLPPVEAAA